MPASSLRQSVAAIAAPFLLLSSSASGGDDPYADSVISYVPGSNPAPAPGYTNPATALGPPERFTGELIAPSVVSPFSPPFGTNEIVSIGAGGSLTLRFNTPITDDASNPYGIDLIVFGNTGFIDSAFPLGVAGGLFGADGGNVEVSADGINWFAVPVSGGGVGAGGGADGLYPTLGYLDSGPYDSTRGSQLSDFTRPVDPGLRASDFTGLSNAQIVALYEGSGGGAGIDIALSGLSQISFVRIVNPAGSGLSLEIDAVSDVAPASSPADLNGDGLVNTLDLGILLSGWSIPATAPACGGAPGPCPADLNGDGLVNSLDLGILLSAWTL